MQIYHLRYADGTTRMAESEEKLKNLLMKVKVQTLTLNKSGKEMKKPKQHDS